MQNNWSLFLDLVVEADEIEEVAKFLEETAARLRRGEHQGSSFYCAGVALWRLCEFDHKAKKWFDFPLEAGVECGDSPLRPEPNVAGSFPMREFSPIENDIESGVLNEDYPPDTFTGEELPIFLSDRSG